MLQCGICVAATGAVVSTATDAVPGCGVETPWSCPAVRRGQSLAFASSESLDACPRLRDVSGGFFFDREERRTHLLPFTREGEEERQALWSYCLAVTGERQSDVRST